MGNICYFLSSPCFLVQSDVVHQGYEIGVLALGLVLVLGRLRPHLFLHAAVFLPGWDAGGLEAVCTWAVCWISHFPQQSEIVCLGLMGMQYCYGEMTLACFVMFVMVSVVLLCVSRFAVPYIRCYFPIFAYAIFVLLGLEVDGKSWGLGAVLSGDVHIPLWPNVVGLGLKDMQCCSVENDSRSLFCMARQGICCHALMFFLCRIIH